MEPISQVQQALEVIENVWRIDVWINKHQCKRVADRLNAIGEGLKGPGLDKNFDRGEASDRSSKEDSPALLELLTVLRKGKTLVAKYGKSEGICSVVARTDNREAFKEIHEELDTMKAQFDFESFGELGEVKDFESTSGVERSVKLTKDADMDVSENLKVLAQMASSEQTTETGNMKKVRQVVREKSESGRASTELPSYLSIDPTAIEVFKPVREYVRQSERDPKEMDDWARVHFGKWLGYDFAIKVLQSKAVDGAGWNLRQLSMEVGSLEKLRHPHIVRFVGFGEDPGRYCVLLMELMDTDLRDFMKKKLDPSPEPKPRPFTRSEELDIITQIAKGMYYLHTQQYSHGDLKCSNVLVKKFDDYLEVKIADLRGSLNLDAWDAEAFKQISMTRRPRWTAPEAIEHYGWVQPSSDLLKKSDVYSFAMTCYEVVTGKYPFDGIKDDDLLKLIKTGVRPELPGELDEDLKQLIKHCWNHDHTKRPEFSKICYLLDYIRSKKAGFYGRDMVLSLTKWIPQVHGFFSGPRSNTPGESAKLVPEQGESAKLVPEQGGSAKLVPEQGESAKLVPEQGESAKLVPEQGGSAKLVPEQGESAKLVPEQGESAKLVPEQGESAKLVPEQGGSAKLVPEQGESAKLVPEQGESAKLIPECLRIQAKELLKVREIGRGRSAEVYEATWLGCAFAVKVFSSNSPIEQVRPEVDFLMNLRHPCIVRLVGLSVDSKEQFSIVMELMSRDLQELIGLRSKTPAFTEKGGVPFDLREALSIITSIASGMAYLHSKQVVHRDLKPGNVMVREHPGFIDVKIVDFGMSQYERVADSSNAHGSSSKTHGLYVGTGSGFYRAPEVLPTSANKSKPKPDLKATDVYSFAITCYEVLTGKAPFSELGPKDYDKVIAGHRPAWPPGLHPELVALVNQCWQGDPVERPSFTKICEELRRIHQALRKSI